jgi:dimethylhistidine N-methyltransferase
VSAANQPVAFLDLHPQIDDVWSEVRAGLRQSAKSLSPKFFYDERGSELFHAITQLEEYYPTRTEMGLFDSHLPVIAQHIGHGSCVIEYGSGSSVKIRKLLQALSPTAYVPVDISKDYLLSNARRLAQDFDALSVFPVCADFSQQMRLPEQVAGLHHVGFFPGSSIGNFEPEQAGQFLRRVAATLGPGGHLLIGVDCKKDTEVLERAYDDAQGVTAAFNLNALEHLNRTLGANFQTEQFQHLARYNERKGCIQMFLRSTTTQRVDIQDEVFAFAEGELLHTENSYKYSPAEFLALAQKSGYGCPEHWLDENGYFGLYLLQVE